MSTLSTLPQGERLHALDGVRASALLLGIILHASLSFVPGMAFWPALDSSAHPAFAGIFFVTHMFRMSLFFMMAGFFARLALHRKGSGSFIKDRLSRITLPLIVFWLPIFASIAAVYIWGAIKANGGAVPEHGTPPPSFSLTTFPLTHLWFLWVLSLIYVGALFLRIPLVWLDKITKLSTLIDRIMALALRTPLGIFLFGAPLIATFATQNPWMSWMGIMTPDVGLIPNIFALVGYSSAFAIGWALQRQPQILQTLAHQWWIYLALAIVATLGALKIIGLHLTPFPVAPGATRWAYALFYVTALWSWSFALIGFGLAFWSKKSALIRYLADSSYWLYLMHLPLVMAGQVYVTDQPWPVGVKFAFVLITTLIPLFISYHILVRNSFIGRWLNGGQKTKASGPRSGPRSGAGEDLSSPQNQAIKA